MYQHRVVRHRPKPKKVVQKKSLKVRTILIAGLVVFALFFTFFMLHDKKNKLTVEKFQRLEPHGRQILMGIQVFYADHLRFPPGQEELERVVKDFDPGWAAETQMLLDYQAAEDGKSFSFSLSRLDDPEFKYHCSNDDGCRWLPHLPYP